MACASQCVYICKCSSGFFSILGFPYSYFQIGWYESCFCKIKGNHSSWKIKKNIVIYCDIYITWKLNYGKHFYKLSEYLFCFMYSVSTIHVEIPQIKSDYLIEMLQWNCSFCKQEKNFVNDKIVYVSLNLMNHRILHVP